jgi:hypothetical protein
MSNQSTAHLSKVTKRINAMKPKPIAFTARMKAMIDYMVHGNPNDSTSTPYTLYEAAKAVGYARKAARHIATSPPFVEAYHNTLRDVGIMPFTLHLDTLPQALPKGETDIAFETGRLKPRELERLTNQHRMMISLMTHGTNADCYDNEGNEIPAGQTFTCEQAARATGIRLGNARELVREKLFLAEFYKQDEIAKNKK